MESGESKTQRLIRSSQRVYTNCTTTLDNGRKYTPKKDATNLSYTKFDDELGDVGIKGVKRVDELDRSAETDDDDLQSRGISIVDTKTKNFSNVTPEEVSDYYKSLGEWQNILPKTDYTYSPMSPYYTKKINGRIPIIPNMCRRNIWTASGAEESEENEVNSYLAKNYEYSETYKNRKSTTRTRQLRRIFRQITTVTTTWVRTVVRRVSEVHTTYTFNSTNSTTSSTANTARNFLVLTALALIFYYFVSGGDFFDIKATTPFVNIFHLFKNLVFYLYDLTVSSTTFLTSLISVCLSNAAQTANTVVFAPLYRVIMVGSSQPKADARREPASHTYAEDLEAALHRWFDKNAENIAAKVISTDEFRKYQQTEGTRFEAYLKGYDFENSVLAEKLRSLETKVTEWQHRPERTQDVDELKARLDTLRDDVKTKDAQVQNEILIILSSFVGGDGSADDLRAKFESLVRLLNETRVKLDTLTAHFDNYTKNVSENSHSSQELFQELEYSWKLSVEEMVSKKLHEFKESAAGQGSVNWNKIDVAATYVNDAIKKALEIYDADKTGKPDFALESQGGIILSTRCTETKTANAQFSIFGIPLWHASRSPRTVIQPGVHPGECWAFPGSTGYLVIQLSERILITGFTMEHIPRSLAANGTIDSAPKDFSVWALKWESDPEPRFLGEFRYDDRGSSVQYFAAILLDEPYHVVELKILSNHGKMDYTCLYRFRVHGVPH